MSIQEVAFYIGVDVASKHLDLFDPKTGKSERIKNDAVAIDSLCQKWKDRSDVMFVMEASGGYESLLVAKLEQANTLSMTSHRQNYPFQGCVPTEPWSVSPCALSR
jgi:transposase